MLVVNNNLDVVYQENDYQESYKRDTKTYTCPDETVEILLSKPTLGYGFETATTGIMEASRIALGAGYKVKLLLNSDETVDAIKNWYACDNLKMHGRIGHGSKHSIITSNGPIEVKYFNQLNDEDLTDLTLYYNSCQVHNNPLEPAIIAADARTFIGGNVNLGVGTSERVFTCWANRTLNLKQGVVTSLKNCESDMNYHLGDHGVTNNGNIFVEPAATSRQ